MPSAIGKRTKLAPLALQSMKTSGPVFRSFSVRDLGPPSGTGLKQLVFHNHSRSYRVKEVPEVCGFAIRDFQEFDGSLWVATELGLSRLTQRDGLQWTNDVPDLSDPMLMRQVECDDLFAELLSSKKFAETEGFDLGFAFDVFWERLSDLWPEFVRRYLRELHGLQPE